MCKYFRKLVVRGGFGDELSSVIDSFCLSGFAYWYSRKLSFWKPVVDCIVSRLSSWNHKFLSFGGRLVLLKFVMSSLPVYFLSFFKAPTVILSSIESIFFFKKNWGSGEDNRKIAWIKWESICTPKEVGGLRVRRVGAFNLSLLGKWCWRMLVEKEGLWYRVLKARYGEDEDG